ncbi:putative membrane protein YeaQ/YmgE (transglycosylase-associated protein family) [Armatimonas rosea]|uniref:Putative membrane protein YeaQ/YmgE (Transglycosylase-associated protein family) n=1 Tax=Armatimonas rosea TaxID=685828 RepID=A0A7W9W9R8_ARMRO|nr:putative membrane protein YeaQ/YmgE (transglycosylase-associated protein family) [Armatimonas rosea]
MGTLLKKSLGAHPGNSQGLLGTSVLSVVGAVTGGWSWNLLLGNEGPMGLELGSLLAATLGALLTLSILHVIRH